MTVDLNQVPNNSEDTFVAAVERLESGEALEVVLATFPEESRADLRELLTIVAATHQLQEIDVPRPTPERRVRAKAAFLQAAAVMRAEAEEHVVAASTPSVNAATRRQAATRTIGEMLATWWADFVTGFAPMSVRLAPLAILVIAIWLGAFSVVSVAQAAIPGDVAYPAKTWVYQQKLALSAPKDREVIYNNIKEEVAQDTELAAERATEEQTIRKASTVLYVVSIGQQLRAGDMDFDLGYLASLDAEGEVPTAIIGLPEGRLLETNDLVSIDYQILPQRTDAEGNIIPSRNQAVTITLVESPVEIPTTVPAQVAPATNTPSVAPNCAAAPAGWVSYSIPPGMPLGTVARITGASISDLVRFNCIVNADVVFAGQTIMVPRLPAPTATPTLPEPTATLEVILTAISTTQLTPSLTITAPIDVTATPIVTVTATVSTTELAETATPEATVALTATLSATIEPTTAVTATVEPGVTPTPQPTVADTVVATPSEEVTPTTAGVITATPAPTTVDSAKTVTPEPTIIGAGDGSTDGTPTAAEPTSAVTPAATVTIGATAAATASAQATTVIATNTPEAISTTVVIDTPEPTATSSSNEQTGGGDSGDANGVSSASAGGGSMDVPAEKEPTVLPPATKAIATATPTPMNQSPLNGG